MYSPVRVSILIKSPMSTKAGQSISAPVSNLTGLVKLVAVLPRTAGSQYSIFNTMWFGGVTEIGLLLNSTMLQMVPSLMLVARVVHEHEHVALAIQVLSGDFGDVGGVERIAPLVGPLQHRVAEQVAELALVEGVAFAGLHEIAFDHQVRIAVDLDLQSFFELAGAEAGHEWVSYLSTGS